MKGGRRRLRHEGEKEKNSGREEQIHCRLHEITSDHCMLRPAFIAYVVVICIDTAELTHDRGCGVSRADHAGGGQVMEVQLHVTGADSAL